MRQHYITEEELAEKLLEFIEGIDISKISISQSLKSSFAEYKKIAIKYFYSKILILKNDDIDIKSYASIYLKKEAVGKRGSL